MIGFRTREGEVRLARSESDDSKREEKRRRGRRKSFATTAVLHCLSNLPYELFPEDKGIHVQVTFGLPDQGVISSNKARTSTGCGNSSRKFMASIELNAKRRADAMHSKCM